MSHANCKYVKSLSIPLENSVFMHASGQIYEKFIIKISLKKLWKGIEKHWIEIF